MRKQNILHANRITRPVHSTWSEIAAMREIYYCTCMVQPSHSVQLLYYYALLM